MRAVRWQWLAEGYEMVFELSIQKIKGCENWQLVKYEVLRIPCYYTIHIAFNGGKCIQKYSHN